MKASVFSFRAAVVFAFIGMSMGIAMAASGNHAVMPAHAHLNLLGWVSLCLFGVFYKLHPQVDSTMLARVQVISWAFGTVALALGVALLYTGFMVGEAIATVGSLVVIVDLLVFAKIVFAETSQRRSVASYESAKVVGGTFGQSSI